MSSRAPSWFVSRLKAIDPDLGIEWLPREGRWAIVQVLWNTPSLETTAQRIADEALPRMLAAGYTVDRPTMEAMAYANVSRRTIVLRVENPDGTPRDLDGRTLDLLRQMAYHRRNRDVKDWLAVSENIEYEAKRSRERAEDALWQATANDKVFTRILSDTLAGLKMRHTSSGSPTSPKEIPA